MISVLSRKLSYAAVLSAFMISAAAVGQVAAPAAPAAPAVTHPGAQAMQLQPLIKKLVDDSQLSATICIYVEDAATGNVMADMNGKEPLAPASNNKLVTTAAGLNLLGPDFQYVTKFFSTGPIANGTLQGNLVVYGTGDPGISGRYQQDKADITALFREWAGKLKAAGISHITGNIVADDSFFDDVYFHPDWYPGERAEYYSAEISALAFNDNCIDINWSGKDLLPETTASFTLNPVTPYVNFSSEVTVAAKGRPTERYYKRGATDNNIICTGNLNVDATALDSASVHDGALFFVNVLSDVLKKEGITVDGTPVKTRGASIAAGVQPLFEHKGTKLLTVCETINLNSQNFFAECVLKTLGRMKGGAGSFEAGTKVVMDFCKQAGIYCTGHRAVDGSGLAGENRVTGRQLVSILRYMDTHGMKDQWRGTLPKGGERGSLKRRFIDREGGKEVAGRILGKTGLIGGVRSLSGIVTDSQGRELYYSIILNRLDNKDAPAGMKLIDTVAIELAKSGGK